jgi:hypothetical protein
MPSSLSDLVAPIGRSPIALTAAHLNLIISDEAIGEAGQLYVSGASGYVVYGPYSHLPAGHYNIAIIATGDGGNGPFARFEVFDGVGVVAEIDLVGPADLAFALPVSASALEFRLYAYGADFTFEKLTLSLIASGSDQVKSPAEPTSDNINRRLEQAWAALHSGADRSVVAELDADIRRFGAGAVTAWASRRGRVRELDAWDEQSLQRSAKALRAAGLSMAALRFCRLDRFEIEAQIAAASGWEDLAKALVEFAPYAEPALPDYLSNLSHTHGVVQFTAAKLGYVACMCPFTGALLKSEHALPVAIDGAKQSYLFYKFSGLKPFYLVVAGFGGRKSFLYFPLDEIVIYIGEPMYNWGDANYAIDQLRKLILINALAVRDYYSAPTTRSVLFGSIDNLGHYFWNDLSGLFRFKEFGALDDVSSALSYRYRFLDTAAVASLHTPHAFAASTPEGLFETCIREALFLFRPTSLLVQTRWAKAIMEYARASLDPMEQRQILKARQMDRLIFFNLRIHNKSWREQVDGAIAVATEAIQRGLSVGLYLDGMPDCAEVARQIQAALPAGAVAIQGFDKPMAATIAWAAACDGYVATIGSGLTTLTWIAGLPGVAHSEGAHLGQTAFWQDVRPDALPPTVVKRDWVTDLGEGAYCNYSIDPIRVGKLLWTLLDKSGGGSSLIFASTVAV